MYSALYMPEFYKYSMCITCVIKQHLEEGNSVQHCLLEFSCCYNVNLNESLIASREILMAALTESQVP